MCGSIFKPKVPKYSAPAAAVIAAPPPTSVAKTMENREVEDARINERRRQAQMGGYKSTDLTGGVFNSAGIATQGTLGKKKLGE